MVQQIKDYVYYICFEPINILLVIDNSFYICIKTTEQFKSNINDLHENEYKIISVCCMANNNNVSSFRDLCLETVKRFIDYKWKCNFGFSTANDILQNGRFFKINFIILSRFFFLFYCNLFTFVVWNNCNLLFFEKDVSSILHKRITFEIMPT